MPRNFPILPAARRSTPRRSRQGLDLRSSLPFSEFLVIAAFGLFLVLG